MQLHRILKTDEGVRGFYLHNLHHELYVLRWLGIVGSILTIAFMYIDYARAESVGPVMTARTIALLWQVAALIVSFSKRISVLQFHIFLYCLTTTLLLLPLYMDYAGGLPESFVPNYLCLYFFLFNAAFGHPLRFKIIQTFVVIVLFVYYATTWSSYESAHITQSFNIAMNALLSIVIGFLIERYKALNYSKQLQLDESMKHNIRMNELKTKMISMLSHDFASPVNNLAALLRLRDKDQITQEELEKNSRKIRHMLSNLSSTMGSLLSWSKLQLDGVRFRRDKLDLPLIVREVVESLNVAANDKNITILNTVEDYSDLYGDTEVIRMALRNFVSNGIKFSKSGSSIYLSSKRNKESITLSVRDEGTGMSDAQLKKLFTNKVESTPGTQGEKGSGIGLVITKDFVEMVGWKLLVRSQEGNGSEFSIEIPIGPAETGISSIN